ncbi:MAG TPA: hypothetical protein VGD36_19980 [Xanthobacteraceae bacterium]
MSPAPIGVRWTVGDVSAHGFESLRLSIWGAVRVFGAQARYSVCVNGLDVGEAHRRTAPVPDFVTWRRCGGLPASIAAHLDAGMAEGVAWKFAPPRLFPDRYELALDNDCILWQMPDAIRRWLDAQDGRCLIAADITLAHGAFTHLTGPQPRNTGIKGLPPGFDLEHAVVSVLDRHPVLLRSELDEQGLQVVAIERAGPAYVVSCEDVWLCSPFWPKAPRLGRCGAHFVGLNMKVVPWSYEGRPALELLQANWLGHRDTLYRRVGLAA